MSDVYIPEACFAFNVAFSFFLFEINFCTCVIGMEWVHGKEEGVTHGYKIENHFLKNIANKSSFLFFSFFFALLNDEEEWRAKS